MNKTKPIQPFTQLLVGCKLHMLACWWAADGKTGGACSFEFEIKDAPTLKLSVAMNSLPVTALN